MDIRESSYNNQTSLENLRNDFYEENQCPIKFYDLCKRAFYHPNLEIKREIIFLLDKNSDDLANYKKISNLFNNCFSNLSQDFEKLPNIKFILSICSNNLQNNLSDLNDFSNLNKRDIRNLNDLSNFFYYDVIPNRMTQIFIQILSFQNIENPFKTIKKKLKSLKELCVTYPYQLLILSDIFKVRSLQKTCLEIINSHFNCKVNTKAHLPGAFSKKKTYLHIEINNNSRIDLESFEKFINTANKNFNIVISLSSSNYFNDKSSFDLKKTINLIESLESKYLKKFNLYGYGSFPIFLIEKLINFKKLVCKIQNKSIPKEIGLLTNLKTLVISNSILKSLPPEIYLLTNLKKLSINNCRKIESIPSEIGNLINLEVLDLKFNSNLKYIPCEIKNLISLEKLNLLDSKKLLPLSFLNIILGFGWERIKEICPSIFYDWTQTTFLIEDIISWLITFKIDAKDLIRNNNPETLTFEILYLFLHTIQIVDENYHEAIDFIKKMPLNTKTIYEFHSIFFSKSLQNFNNYLCSDVKIYLDELCWETILQIYFKSNDDSFDKNFLDSESIIEILLTPKGKEILIKSRDAIFLNHPLIYDFIYENYPINLQENIKLYPIEVFYKEELMNIDVICFQSDLEDYKKIISFLHLFDAVAPYTPWNLFVRYRNQIGIDQGALGVDFVTNLFKTLSKKWKLYKGIPSKYIPEFKELSRIFSFVFENPEYVLGPVLSEDFYKTIVRFDYRQLTSRIHDLTEIEILKIAEGYLNGIKFNHLKEALDSLLDVKPLTIQDICDLHDIHSFKNLPSEIIDKESNIILESLRNWIECDLERIPFLKSIIQKELFAEIRMQLKMLQNLFQIRASKDDWMQITREGYKELMISFEGMFDRQFLIDCIYFKNINSEVEEAICEWLNNISEEQLKKFTALVTGSSQLSIRSIIKIVSYNTILNEEEEIDISKNKIYVHGCFSKIKIPACLTDKDSIQAAFYQITEGEKEFNMS